MNERRAPSFDPEKLRRERKDANLGAPDETSYGHVDNENELQKPTGAHENPTSGATPPAR